MRDDETIAHRFPSPADVTAGAAGATAHWPLVASPDADLQAALTGSLAPETIVQALKELEDITQSFSMWVRDVHVDVFRRLNGEAPVADAPPAFDLTAWRAGSYCKVFNGNRLFAEIDAQLTQIGAMASAVAATAGAARWIPTADVDAFVTEAADVSCGLRRLLGDLWNRLANIDPLTGLGNRPAMLHRLAIESERHARHHMPCCIALLDIDHFKVINDTYGHSAGDAVLRSIAALLAASLRPYDAVFRYGGEEFVLCLPNTDPRSAWAIAERLRLKVANWAVPVKGKGEIRVTISIGIAPLTSELGVEGALELADAALYTCKAQGRNAVVVRVD